MVKILILKEHKTWIAVNKPAGLSVHNQEDKTNLIQELEAQGYPDFAPVNRLDKETSGVMILSNQREASHALQVALAAETCKKTYMAIVRGKFKDDEKKGEWDKDLTNKAEGRNNPQGIKAQRVLANTAYKVIKENKYLSLLEVMISSGRQHQIRKHAILSKHQVIGDSRYGEKKFNKMIAKTYSFNNMALHSKEIVFQLNKKTVKIRSEVPDTWDLVKF